MKKKLFFLFALLASMTASATVIVTPLATDYTNRKVTFSVAWTDKPSVPYSNRVWVWIDYCAVNGTSPGSFTPATITSSTITGGNGTITNATARGFFVEYGATNAGTTITATLSNAPADKFNWCVYGSDAPPNVTAAGGIYTLHGSPPFTLIAANGTATQTVEATSIATSAVTIMPVTLTDQTGYPGVFCIYTGSDLYIDADHLCQQRTSGAQNWEAYIRDERDETIYRITQFSDNTWWMAEDMTYATKKISTCGGFSWYRISDNPGCPDGWLLPTNIQFGNRFPTATDNYGGVVVRGNGWHDNGLGCQTYNYALYVVAGCTNCVYRDDTWAYHWCYKTNTQEGDCNSTYYNSGRIRCYR